MVDKENFEDVRIMPEPTGSSPKSARGPPKNMEKTRMKTNLKASNRIIRFRFPKLTKNTSLWS